MPKKQGSNAPCCRVIFYSIPHLGLACEPLPRSAHQHCLPSVGGPTQHQLPDGKNTAAGEISLTVGWIQASSRAWHSLVNKSWIWHSWVLRYCACSATVWGSSPSPRQYTNGRTRTTTTSSMALRIKFMPQTTHRNAAGAATYFEQCHEAHLQICERSQFCGMVRDLKEAERRASRLEIYRDDLPSRYL